VKKMKISKKIIGIVIILCFVTLVSSTIIAKEVVNPIERNPKNFIFSWLTLNGTGNITVYGGTSEDCSLMFFDLKNCKGYAVSFGRLSTFHLGESLKGDCSGFLLGYSGVTKFYDNGDVSLRGDAVFARIVITN